MAIDEGHDLFIDQPAQHHLDNIHSLFIGYPLSLNKGRLLAHPLHGFADLRPASMYNHRPDTDEVKEHHILGKTLFKPPVDLRSAPILDDKGLPIKVPY